ncbi:MAG: Sua5/YciO/YrdC/YwlC family protein [Bacteroidota bacterium]|nr:Sua5/YciO/YrdC/YwlC family protein [Bacteroidota bacterium]
MLIEVHPENADDRKIEQIVHILENDGLIVIPTDTIYAFAVSLNSKKGLEKLAKIKEVKLKKSEFSLILNSLSSISNYTKPIDRRIFRVIKNAIPGPFTFILQANNQVSKLFGSNKKEEAYEFPIMV